MSEMDVNGSGLPASLTFNQTEITIIDRAGHPWVSAADLARAIGYADARAVSKLFDRNAGEFSDDMALVVNLTTRGAVAAKPTRLFSPRGCHLVAMLARTARARAFRRWVLDVLERLDQDRPLLPAPERERPEPAICQGCALRTDVRPGDPPLSADELMLLRLIRRLANWWCCGRMT